MTTDARPCYRCEELYPVHVAYFKRERKCASGYRGICRHCLNAQRRDLRAEKKRPKPPRLTESERHKAYRARKKAERIANVLKGVKL